MSIWITEYSPIQRVFHVDTLPRILAANRDAIAKGHNPGFVPLYIAVSQEEAHAFAERWSQEHSASDRGDGDGR